MRNYQFTGAAGLFMQVHFTYDVEIWGNGWPGKAGPWPAAFRRFTYGPLPREREALPVNLHFLRDNAMRAVPLHVEATVGGLVGRGVPLSNAFQRKHLAPRRHLASAGPHRREGRGQHEQLFPLNGQGQRAPDPGLPAKVLAADDFELQSGDRRSEDRISKTVSRPVRMVQPQYGAISGRVVASVRGSEDAVGLGAAAAGYRAQLRSRGRAPVGAPRKRQE